MGFYLHSVIPKSLSVYISLPGGLMYVREWNNMQYASAAAFLLAVYSDYLSAANAKLTCPDGQIQPHEVLNFAKSQVYIYTLPSQLRIDFKLNNR